MHIRIRDKKYFLGMKKRVIGPWILISTLVFHMWKGRRAISASHYPYCRAISLQR
jgi:hypothetical protein